MRSKGKIASWNDDKGCGFITPLAGGKKVFIHVKALRNRHPHPEINDVVSYTLSKDKQGRPCAADVTLAGDRRKEKTARKSNPPGILLALVFLFALGIAAATGFISSSFLIAYAVMSFITFAAYAFDKSAAHKGHSRIREAALHLCSLAGGWPGALIARQALPHKSRKASFRKVFWATVVINCAVLVWLLTESGRTILERALGL